MGGGGFTGGEIASKVPELLSEGAAKSKDEHPHPPHPPSQRKAPLRAPESLEGSTFSPLLGLTSNISWPCCAAGAVAEDGPPHHILLCQERLPWSRPRLPGTLVTPEGNSSAYNSEHVQADKQTYREGQRQVNVVQTVQSKQI